MLGCEVGPYKNTSFFNGFDFKHVNFEDVSDLGLVNGYVLAYEVAPEKLTKSCSRAYEVRFVFT